MAERGKPDVEAAKMLVQQAEKQAQQASGAAPSSDWRWSKDGWSADQKRSKRQADTATDPDGEN